ncbi:MAG: hypothetical protein ACFFCB_03285 [Candidatus Odinarchaeota archaeon]
MSKIRSSLSLLLFCSFTLLIFTGTPLLAAQTGMTISSQNPVSPQHSQVIPIPIPLTPRPPPTETVAIVVENALYAGVSAAVTQYRTDLNNSGYNTILYTSNINNHTVFRSLLNQWYTTYPNFVGAVIIGRLPFAQFYHPAASGFAAETFICDLFLMDLDGSWYDTGMPGHAAGVYDVHNASGGADILPEIFIGRIDPLSINAWDTPTNYINAYLGRAHTYRTGGLQRQNRALMYVDDDWSGYWASVWNNDLGLAYSTRTFVDIPVTWTNATDWINNRVVQNYQWGHICVHSFATSHVFGPGGGGAEGSVTSNQIRLAPAAFNFYNLFACHGSQWTVASCLGTTYAFTGSHSLAVIGSTKTGGMMDCDEFYGPIGQNDTLGESLLQWFQNSLTTSSTAGTLFLEWYYGMNIIGDPFLTTIYDCTVLPTTISSSTHPDQAAWYLNGQPQFNWTIPVDVNGISGYYYIIDQNPSTVPTSSTGTFTATNGTQPASALADGTWYLHVVPVDNANNVGTIAAHYQVGVDATNPTVAISSPTPGALVPTQFVLTWSITETGSGYSRADVYVNGTLFTTINAPTMNATITHNIAGSFPVNVTVHDTSGLRGSDQIIVTIAGAPGIPGFPFEAIALGAIMALGIGVYYRRKRKPA